MIELKKLFAAAAAVAVLGVSACGKPADTANTVDAAATTEAAGNVVDAAAATTEAAANVVDAAAAEVTNTVEATATEGTNAVDAAAAAVNGVTEEKK
jgi:hypothetical protein